MENIHQILIRLITEIPIKIKLNRRDLQDKVFVVEQILYCFILYQMVLQLDKVFAAAGLSPLQD